ncbi:MAG: hypothetical protein HZC41_25060 [Chloroflexi bacterium]|nr:hypothetical protein [Chloroflexota bacterium]
MHRFMKCLPSRRELLFVVVFTLLLVAAIPVGAQSQTLQLDIDPSPLFASISAYVPLFFGILAVAGGILIGKRIAEFVIKAIADAF